MEVETAGDSQSNTTGFEMSSGSTELSFTQNYLCNFSEMKGAAKAT